MTASGSSWGRDCLLMPRRGKAGKRKRKNLPFPDREEERVMRMRQTHQVYYGHISQHQFNIFQGQLVSQMNINSQTVDSYVTQLS